MYLIMNADDFGLCDDTVDATIELLQSGVLTSATLMSRMPASDRAVSFAVGHPEIGFGVHLTFVQDTVERAVSDPRLIPALVDGDGNFMPSNTLRRRLLLRQIPRKQLEIEIAAQLQYFLDAGVRISHVDSHGHMHKIGVFPRALANVLPRFGISRVRAVQNVSATAGRGWYTRYLGLYWGPRIRMRFETTDLFLMLRDHSDLAWLEADSPWLRRLLGSPQHTTMEAGFHPGSTEEWRRVESDVAARFADAARRAGVQFGSWDGLPARRKLTASPGGLFSRLWPPGPG